MKQLQDIKNYLVIENGTIISQICNENIEINNNKIIVNRSSEAINAKMNSDKALLSYKNDIAEASKYLNSEETLYVAGAMVVKYDNRVFIKICGFDHNLKRYSSNYYLYFAILNYYQNKFSYADLDGITADLSKEGKYYGLNRFKLGFNPDIYEYPGEFDLIINNFENLLKTL